MHEERIVVNQGGAYPLEGILTLPEMDKPVAGVVLVHGSGSSNKDEKVMKLTPFKDIAQGLAQRGIASLRYDKRSFVHARKMLKDGIIDVRKETIEDAVEATSILKKDPRIDANKVFIIGHSMGGMLAPRIDNEGGNYAGIIIMAGSPRNLDEILIGQVEEMISKQRFIAKWILEKQLHKYRDLFNKLPNLSPEDAKKIKFGGGTTLYYWKEMNEHPVSAYLEDLQKPLLLLQGAKDFQVKMDKDYALYQKMLEGHENATFKLYPDLNHCFVEAISDDITRASKEYGVERHIPGVVMDDIAAWIKGIQ